MVANTFTYIRNALTIQKDSLKYIYIFIVFYTIYWYCTNNKNKKIQPLPMKPNKYEKKKRIHLIHNIYIHLPTRQSSYLFPDEIAKLKRYKSNIYLSIWNVQCLQFD